VLGDQKGRQLIMIKDGNNKAEVDAWRHLSLSDLTIKEIRQLVKCYLTALFACILLFGLPFALIVTLDFGLRTSLTGHEYSWWSTLIGYGFLAWFTYMVLSNIPAFFEWWRDLFADLYKWARSVSRSMQILGFIFLVCYTAAWGKYPKATFWFSITIFLPGGFTYEKYKKILKLKAQNQTANS
jgi:hypothetical protein